MVLSKQDIEQEIVAAETSIKTAEKIKALSEITISAFKEALKNFEDSDKS